MDDPVFMDPTLQDNISDMFNGTAAIGMFYESDTSFKSWEEAINKNPSYTADDELKIKQVEDNLKFSGSSIDRIKNEMNYEPFDNKICNSGEFPTSLNNIDDSFN